MKRKGKLLIKGSLSKVGTMTSERKLIIGAFALLYVFVAATWAGWKALYKFHDCQDQARDIERSADDTSNLIFSVWIFGDNMPANKKAAAKFYLGKAEPRWQKAIERYAENCRDRAAKDRLVFMLKGFELYLITKQNIYKGTEAAGLDWIRKTMPIDALLE